MQEDNMYTRRSTVQSVPLEQEKAANEEFLKVLNEAPLIKAEIELLIADAEALENSVLAISEKALEETPELFVREVLANRKAAASIRASVTRMEALIEEHLKNR